MRGMGRGDWRVGYVKGEDGMVEEYRRCEERVEKGVGEGRVM